MESENLCATSLQQFCTVELYQMILNLKKCHTLDQSSMNGSARIANDFMYIGSETLLIS